MTEPNPKVNYNNNNTINLFKTRDSLKSGDLVLKTNSWNNWTHFVEISSHSNREINKMNMELRIGT